MLKITLAINCLHSNKIYLNFQACYSDRRTRILSCGWGQLSSLSHIKIEMSPGATYLVKLDQISSQVLLIQWLTFDIYSQT